VQGSWNIVSCRGKDCGLAWVSPMPETSTIKELYVNYYTHASGVPQGQRHVSDATRGGSSFINVLRRFLGITSARNNAEMMGLSRVSPGRLLDVGCGDGERLIKFYSHGWVVEGIDVDEVAVRNASTHTGLNISVGTLESLSLPENSYDAVIMNHVLEHVECPLTQLASSKKLLKSGGYLVIRVPNFNSRGHRFFKEFWRGIEVPRHFFHFTCPSLRRMTAMIGMDGCRVYSDNTNAEIMFTSSFMLSRNIPANESHKLGKAPRMASLLWQIISRIDLYFNPDSGEECVLVWRAP
jgi:2-polyprenyl-3-methyl-5-hydroxy-6-metoxy-1,4-benzoquinol methylase